MLQGMVLLETKQKLLKGKESGNKSFGHTVSAYYVQTYIRCDIQHLSICS